MTSIAWNFLPNARFIVSYPNVLRRFFRRQNDNDKLVCTNDDIGMGDEPQMLCQLEMLENGKRIWIIF